nr:hypothetical protein [Escherichia coli]USC09635.1 hypothetical protein K4906_00140 [Escherichia coli]
MIMACWSVLALQGEGMALCIWYVRQRLRRASGRYGPAAPGIFFRPFHALSGIT